MTSTAAAGATGGAMTGTMTGAKPPATTGGAMTGAMTGTMTGAKPPATTGGAMTGAMTGTMTGAMAGTMSAGGTAGAAPSGGAAGSTGSQSPDGTPKAGAGSTDTMTTGTPSGSDDLTGDSKCLADITSGFDKEGPFQVKMEREGSVNFWVPAVPEGCKVPIIHLANGTGASCSSYGQALQRFATHGFLTCCYENPNTGAGTQGLEAFKTAMTKYPNLAAKRYGSTGHSQGGQSAFVVQALAEKEFGLDGNKFAGLAMQPASGFGTQPAGSWQMQYKSIKSPMFMFSGQGSDGLVSQGWVMDAFNNLDKGIEAYFWAKAGGMHIPTPQGEEMQIGPAWFRWKLLGDNNACKFFKSIPMMDNTWEEVAKQNEANCE
ncbi:MAG TPA: hypothetical protein VFN67_26570 [Polyangiales bacterium]|nr:hypothetical protein [Polyangiales bacterium]